ncbi:MAG: hypothetical protein KAR32_13820 [Candidatus Omnitrophica bacterium]|nr:hypothetical protein [Candidatus Omnitrophota bacterium]
MPGKLNKDDVAFEITFYNGLIEKNPDFVEALVALGDLYTKAGMYKEGLAIDEKLVQLRPDDPLVLYNLACSYSLLKDIDKAFRAFKKAINCGYCDFEHLQRDEDLTNLRKDRRFQQYLARIKAKKPSRSAE